MIRKIVRPLLAGIGAVGALVLVNRGLSGGLPISHLEGIQRRWTWRGHEVFATEAGEGPLVVMVHGVYAGASSFEYRHLFGRLSARHRVIAFDFLGCGLSDKPNLDYNADVFVEQIVDAVAQFTEGPVTLIGSQLGAAFAIRAAVRSGPRVRGLVAICPTGLGGVLDGAESPMRNATTPVLRAPVVGESVYNLLASKQYIRRFLEREAYGDADSVTDEVVDNYYAVTHQPGARWVPAAFLGGRLDCDVARDLPFVEAPLLVLWGKRATINPARNAPEYAELAKRAQVEYFVKSALLPHEEEPDLVAERIERFVTEAAPL